MNHQYFLAHPANTVGTRLIASDDSSNGTFPDESSDAINRVPTVMDVFQAQED